MKPYGKCQLKRLTSWSIDTPPSSAITTTCVNWPAPQKLTQAQQIALTMARTAVNGDGTELRSDCSIIVKGQKVIMENRDTDWMRLSQSPISGKREDMHNSIINQRSVRFLKNTLYSRNSAHWFILGVFTLCLILTVGCSTTKTYEQTVTMDDPKVVNGVVIEIPIANPSFESGPTGWSSPTIDNSEYYAPPDGTCYATRSGSSGYTSQLTGHTIAAGETYTLTVWARSINAAANSTATNAEVRFYYGSSTITAVTQDVYPVRLSGAPATIHNDDGGNVWLDGNYRMSSAQHIFYQTIDKDPINDPWFDAGEHPHGCGMANIMTPEGLNAIYGCSGYNEETLYSGQDFSIFTGSPPFYSFSDVGEPVVCHEGDEDPWIIDAHLYYDDDTGRLWMTWGGGGIYVSELDPYDGFLIDHPAEPWFDTHPPGTHTKVAVWGGDQWSQDWVEGPSLYKHNGYWYLFLTCGNMNANYTIRMGRGTSPTGPFYDKDGVGLMEYDSGENRYGNSILLGDEGEYLVPGHPHLWEENGTYYMGYDYRPNSTTEPDLMGIRRLYWVNDWPTIWTPITATFNADDHPDTIGQTLGISLRNTGSGSTAVFDYVTLTVSAQAAKQVSRMNENNHSLIHACVDRSSNLIYEDRLPH